MPPVLRTTCKRWGQAAGVSITDWASLKAAAAQRVEYFHSVGGRMADHGANTFFFAPATDQEVEDIVARAIAGETPDASQVRAYQTALTLCLWASMPRMAGPCRSMPTLA